MGFQEKERPQKTVEADLTVFVLRFRALSPTYKSRKGPLV